MKVGADVPEATRFGRELLPVFQRVLRVIDAAAIGACDLAARRRGVVRVAALPFFAASPLAQAFALYGREHPRVPPVPGSIELPPRREHAFLRSTPELDAGANSWTQWRAIYDEVRHR